MDIASKNSSGAGSTKPLPSSRTPGIPQSSADRSVSNAGPVPEPSESRMNRIARRAHEIYEARGGEHGKALEDWLQAEREIDAADETSRADG
jgi:DUF2934 family protein